jgi:hypothetical protein
LDLSTFFTRDITPKTASETGDMAVDEQQTTPTERPSKTVEGQFLRRTTSNGGPERKRTRTYSLLSVWFMPVAPTHHLPESVVGGRQKVKGKSLHPTKTISTPHIVTIQNLLAGKILPFLSILIPSYPCSLKLLFRK